MVKMIMVSLSGPFDFLFAYTNSLEERECCDIVLKQDNLHG